MPQPLLLLLLQKSKSTFDKIDLAEQYVVMTKFNFVTNATFQKEMNKFRKEMTDFKSELKEIAKSLQNRIVDSEVKILGELQKMRESNDAHSFSHLRIDEDVENLQKRVSKLETGKN